MYINTYVNTYIFDFALVEFLLHLVTLLILYFKSENGSFIYI